MLQLNIYPAKILSGILAGFLALFIQNLLPLFLTVMIFELVDFVTGEGPLALPCPVQTNKTEKDMDETPKWEREGFKDDGSLACLGLTTDRESKEKPLPIENDI